MLSVGGHLLPVKCKTNSGCDLIRSEGWERRRAKKFSHDPYITREHNLKYEIL
jgi:hypothetical protein